jgi:hypothetical protein
VYDGQLYERDLAKCRRALLQRQIEGAIESTDELGRMLRLHTRTVQRFLSGDEWFSIETTIRLLAVLGLHFNDVHRKVRVIPIDETDRGTRL